ncbi:MAG: hypothetical protein CMJ21_01200 [Phycisphaerae bacterium]|nr:hypothetical protein [Phycisphaerae bacterium]
MLRAGAVQVDLTPAGRLRGRHNLFSIVEPEKPIYARVVALELNGQIVLAIACDVMGVTSAAADRLENAVANAAGVAPVDTIFWPTHTHSCPCMNPATESVVQEHGLGISNQQWLDTLEQRLCVAARRAIDQLEPVTVAGGVGPVKGIAANRIIEFPDGTVGMRSATTADCPAGNIDPNVRSLFLLRADGNPMAILCNYAVHPTSLGGGETSHINPDFPGYAADVIRQRLGDEVSCLFGMGAAGDINCRKYAPRSGTRSVRDTRRLGEIFAGEVVRQFQSIDRAVTVNEMNVSTHRYTCEMDRELTAPLEELNDSLLCAVDVYRRTLTQGKAHDIATAQRALVEAQWQHSYGHALDESGAVPVVIRRLTLDDEVCILFAAGEYFVEIGKAVFDRSPFAHTMFVTAANITPLYVPDQSAFDRLAGRGDAYGVDRMRLITRHGCINLAQRLVKLAESG